MQRQNWVRFPTDWIVELNLLTDFKWGKDGGSAHTSALMCLTAIAHNTNEDTGIARVSYDQFGTITGRSRTSIANGLSVLKDLNLIESIHTQSEYLQPTYDRKKGWGKLPSKALYRGDSIHCFHDFTLRSRVELDALKLFYLFVAFRDNHTNLARIGYDKIDQRTGLGRQNIRRALSFLSANSLVYVEKIVSEEHDESFANTYRVCGIDPYIHGGTRGREDIAA